MISPVASGAVTFSTTLSSARAQERFCIKQIWWEQAGRGSVTQESLIIKLEKTFNLSETTGNQDGSLWAINTNAAWTQGKRWARFTNNSSEQPVVVTQPYDCWSRYLRKPRAYPFPSENWRRQSQPPYLRCFHSFVNSQNTCQSFSDTRHHSNLNNEGNAGYLQ